MKAPVHNKQVIEAGKTFGFLKIVREVDAYVSKGGRSCRQFLLECKCGALVTKKIAPIREGRVVSCGCHNKEKKVIHGQSNQRLYKVWTGMKQRCENPNNIKYHLYGGKGIRVCDEWKEDPLSFISWSLQNGYKKGLTLDRVSSEGSYSPNNCRWVDYTIQNNNTSRNHWVEILGEKKTVAQWCKDERCVVSLEAFTNRIARGWEPLMALTKPAQNRKK